MSRIRTLTHLQSALDSAISWRTAEIASLKSAITASSDIRRTALLRASIPIAYAHWEGFIKRSAADYGLYISSQGHHYSELKECLRGLKAIGSINDLSVIKRRISAASNILSSIYSIPHQKANINLWPIIEQVGNLTHDTFVEIAEFLAISIIPYSAHRHYIDEVLVKNRNEIAHGESTRVDQAGAFAAFDEVMTLTRMFKSDIENAATNKDYLV